MSEVTPQTRDSAYHGKNHGETGRDKVIHRLLGFLHRDTTAADPVRGDIIVAQGAPPFWARYAIAPAASGITRKAFIADNGDLEPTYKDTLDATAPTTIAENDTAAPGTSLIYSHRDHKHGSPATWKATAHNLLDGDRHGDTVAQSPTRGSIVYSNSTPKWDELVLGSAGQILSSVASDITWVTPASESKSGGSLASTTNTTGLMGGIAGSITPTFSGRVLFTAYGQGFNATAVDGYTVGIRTGTGSAPTAGAALTGTLRGVTQSALSAGSNYTVPFSISVVVTGLVVGTTLWIDLSKASLAGGSATISASYISALEF